MINKITSKELSEVMDTAEQRESDIQETVDTIRLNIDRQMGLFKNSVEYANSQLSSFQENSGTAFGGKVLGRHALSEFRRRTSSWI